jgi:hypothetical protein
LIRRFRVVDHPVFLGLREDKPAPEAVLAVPDPEAPRRIVKPPAAATAGRS